MSLPERLKRYFIEQPKPAAVFQVASSRVACLKVEAEAQSLEDDFFIQRISAGAIEPHFSQPNVKQPEILEELVERAIQKLKIHGNSVTVILPEMSSRVFVFSLSGTFINSVELNKFIDWRLDRQLAQPLSEVRYSYQVFNSGSDKKVLVVCSGLEVVKEYEAIFQKKKLHPGKLTIPSLSVFNLFSEIKEEDFIVADADYDYLSLGAVVGGTLYLYRQKQLSSPVDSSFSSALYSQDAILKEIENTFHFIEDKTRKKPELLGLRLNLEEKEILKRKIQQIVEAEIVDVYPENQAIAPLLGGL